MVPHAIDLLVNNPYRFACTLKVTTEPREKAVLIPSRAKLNQLIIPMASRLRPYHFVRHRS
jgi:hypothetical protein